MDQKVLGKYKIKARFYIRKGDKIYGNYESKKL